MPERQTTEKLEPSFDPSCINNDRSRGWGLEDTTIGWVSASILHDLRNPLGTICAGAELLMDLDSTSTQVKRLAANMCRAAGRMRQLLGDLASVARDNGSGAEVCDIREVIASASAAASASMEQGVQILLDVPDGIDLPLVRSHIER